MSRCLKWHGFSSRAQGIQKTDYGSTRKIKLRRAGINPSALVKMPS